MLRLGHRQSPLAQSGPCWLFLRRSSPPSLLRESVWLEVGRGKRLGERRQTSALYLSLLCRVACLRSQQYRTK